jgi:hypothetical protein
MEVATTWEAYQYLVKAKDELIGFVSQYNLKKVNPLLYLPLKENFVHVIGVPHTYTYPYMKPHAELVESIDFRKDGFHFNGTSMVGVYTENIPSGSEPRSFVCAIKPTEYPVQECPMFVFSYGKREHDRAFGLFWGVPQVKGKNGKEDKTRKSGLKAFTYCAIEESDRTSEICDFDMSTEINLSNEWIVVALTYDGQQLKAYVDGVLSLTEEIRLNTYKTKYLNIGGFIHHTEDGGLNPKDMEYSMKGYIREFMMFDRCLSEQEILGATKLVARMANR